MKIAIVANGNLKKSMMDKRFGRCLNFCVFDDESKTVNFYKKPGHVAQEGTSPVAAQFLVNEDVKKIIASKFRGKVKTMLEQLQIQMVL